MSDLHAVRIAGTIELSDGSATSFSIEPNLGWQQWGQRTEVLGVTVALLDDLTQAVAEHLHEEED